MWMKQCDTDTAQKNCHISKKFRNRLFIPTSLHRHFVYFNRTVWKMSNTHHKAAGLPTPLKEMQYLQCADTNTNAGFLLARFNSYFIVKVTIAGLFRRHIPADLSTRSDPLFFSPWKLAWPPSYLLFSLCATWAYILQIRPDPAVVLHTDTHSHKLKKIEIHSWN